MSKNSLNAKCGIELKALVPLKMSVPMNWDLWGPFSSTCCPNEEKYPKTRTIEPSHDYLHL